MSSDRFGTVSVLLNGFKPVLPYSKAYTYTLNVRIATKKHSFTMPMTMFFEVYWLFIC